MYLCIVKVCERYLVEILRPLLVDGCSHLPLNVGDCYFIMASKLDLTGSRFGRLTVLCKDCNDTQGRMWLCQCDCGNKKSIRVDHLKTGATTSCGCYNREVASKRNRTHGMTKSPEYAAWEHMKARCENPSDSRFHCYGARGIKVCERWRGENGFQNFIADMGLKPGRGYSIDRINNDGDYEPSNCKWSTDNEQANNKSNNIYISYQGETKTLKEWSRELGLDYKNLWERMKYYGWSFEKTIKTKKRETVSRLVEYNGATKTLAQWCHELHLTYATIKSRLDNGWPVQKAFEQPIRRW